MLIRTLRLIYGYLAVSLALLILAPSDAMAIGEVFRIDTSGTEYCGDFQFGRFSGRTAVPLWVRLDSDTQITVSLTPSFAAATSFPMFGYFYLTKNGSAELVAGIAFADGAYATIEGAAQFDKKTGVVKQLSGTFIQNSVLFQGCFSAGKFRSVRK